MLLQAGANKDLLDLMFRDACRCGDLETAQWLLNYVANMDWQDDSGRTVLMEVACQGHAQIAELLLQYRQGHAGFFRQNSSDECSIQRKHGGHTKAARSWC